MKGFSVVAAAAVFLAAGSPALAACKNAAGQAVTCAPKPVAKATPQAAAKPIAKKGCPVGGKLGPCKVKSHETDATGRVNYKW